METPKFANHLPEGDFLDWAFRITQGKENFAKTAGESVVRELWDYLDDASAARATARTEDPALLEWVALNTHGRSGIRTALLSNPSATLETIVIVLEETREPRDREILEKSRSTRDLGELLTRGLLEAGHPRQGAEWVAAHVAEQAGTDTLQRALDTIEEQHHALFLSELLRTDPLSAVFDLQAAGSALRELPPQVSGDGTWRLLAEHMAARGSEADKRALIGSGAPVAFTAELFKRHAIDAQTALEGLTPKDAAFLVKRLPAERKLDEDELRVFAHVELDSSDWHDRRYTAEAAAWAVENGSEDLAAGAGWFVESDPLLVRLLRRNTKSHAFAHHHLWRLGRLWPRLSNKTRSLVVAAMDPNTLGTINVAEIRHWIVSKGPVEVAAHLQLGKNETKLLVERVEQSLDADLAWLAARAAERPRDRVRMAEIGLRGKPDRSLLREWVKASSSGEIVRLWYLVTEEIRDDFSAILVATLQRHADDTAWVEKILPELRTAWQHAPHVLQEHAGRWLSENVTGEKGRLVAWSLYPEWTGTLEELANACREL